MAIYDAYLGLGIMFGLAFFLTYIFKGGLVVFFASLLIFNGFVVLGGLLELWTLFLNLIISSGLIFYGLKRGRQ